MLLYNQATVAYRGTFAMPTQPGHPIDAFNLRDPQYGLFAYLQHVIQVSDIEHGRIDIRLAPRERHVWLTVNEYETLLMRHDLVDVLRNPLHFAKVKGLSMIDHPRQIPGKTLSYAKYDGVRVLNSLMETLRLDQSSLERLVAKIMAFPARRFIRSRRVSFFAAQEPGASAARVVRGTYQSPILVQWQTAEREERRLSISIVELSASGR